jgi:hypothetical protein
MSEVHPACLPDDQLLAECEVRHERRSGPGGQHRNKVATAVVLTHRRTGIRGEANERRSQAENGKQALRRLRVRLAIEIRSAAVAAGEPVPPSPRWTARSTGGRLAINPEHDDFPALLAEALDAVATAKYDVTVAANSLGISMSQLIRLLKHEPAAWAQLNDSRRQRGLRPLH